MKPAARNNTTTGTTTGTTTAALAAVLFGAATFLVGSVPLAQAAPPTGGQDRFPISIEEMDAHRAEVFASVDSNGDGLISAEEFALAELPKPPRGHKPKGQWKAAQQADMDENLFHALDKDTDGVISRDEFSTQVMREARMASMKSHLFERADQDGDGYLSPDEFPPRRLARLDANGDGEISRDELPDRPGARSWDSNPS